MKKRTGYSGTPLAQKLGVKSGSVVVVTGAPEGWAAPDLPPDVTTKTSLRGSFDVAVVFVRSAPDLRRRAAAVVKATPDDGAVWIAWPRKAGGHVSDVTENLLREVLLPAGLVDVKVAALDEDWSGLKFMWRRERRGEAEP